MFKHCKNFPSSTLSTNPPGIDKRTIDTDDCQHDWSEFLDKVNAVFSA